MIPRRNNLVKNQERPATAQFGLTPYNCKFLVRNPVRPNGPLPTDYREQSIKMKKPMPNIQTPTPANSNSKPSTLKIPVSEKVVSMKTWIRSAHPRRTYSGVYFTTQVLTTSGITA